MIMLTTKPIERGAASGLIFLAALTLISLPCAAAKQGGSERLPLDSFLSKIQKTYRGTHALEADFTQTYSSGDRARTESGRVIFARGGRMRWDYRQPEGKIFVSNGKTVELYLPSENQVQKSSVKQSEDYRVPFRLLLSRLDFKKYFSQIEDISSAKALAPGDRIIAGIPKGGKNRPYDRVLIEFDSNLDIRRLAITYRDESQMEFIFSHIRRNPPLIDSTFEFTPPAGAEVIDQSGQDAQ